MAVSGDDPAGVGTLSGSTFNGARGRPLLGRAREEVSIILFFEIADSGAREGDSGGRTGNNVFIPSLRDTSGTDETAEALTDGIATGGK